MCLIFSSPKPPQFGEEMLLQSREGELSLVTPQTSDSVQIIIFLHSFACPNPSVVVRIISLPRPWWWNMKYSTVQVKAFKSWLTASFALPALICTRFTSNSSLEKDKIFLTRRLDCQPGRFFSLLGTFARHAPLPVHYKFKTMLWVSKSCGSPPGLTHVEHQRLLAVVLLLPFYSCDCNGNVILRGWDLFGGKQVCGR